MLRNAHPIGRIVNAEEVAAFYAYMATDLAGFFTGAVLMMDGGYTASKERRWQPCLQHVI
jgi:enoyl-[acyl-carrier-protein] reductase (NADH)